MLTFHLRDAAMIGKKNGARHMKTAVGKMTNSVKSHHNHAKDREETIRPQTSSYTLGTSFSDVQGFSEFLSLL